jgi:acyl-coenzyme A thioesterase PaaI-like protein
MPTPNPFAEIDARYTALPPRLRRPLVTQAVGEVIPFVDTAGCFIDTYTPTEVTVRLDNRPGVQNHLSGLHAAALALLAESATGLVVALNVPDGSAPLLRTMDLSFDQFTQEGARATATLSTDEAESIRSRSIGQLGVDVRLAVPGADSALVEGQLKWAWLPEERIHGDG